MNQTSKSRWILLKQSLQNPRLALVLQKACHLHRKMETDFESRMRRLSSKEMKLGFPHLDLPFAQYFQRNFFSILMLSLFRHAGISKERVQEYGLIVHGLRGVVTASDNILDCEAKGAFELSMPGGLVLPNIFSILLQQGLLHEVITDMARDRQTRIQSLAELMGALYAIAHEECNEEEEITVDLEPDDLMESVHHFRGGKLLELAFVVPALLESEHRATLEVQRQGIHQIGLALQILDDVTDFEIDFKQGNHNMLRSWIVHRNPDGIVLPPPFSREQLNKPEIHFPKATRAVLNLALSFALRGFSEIADTQYPINEGDALSLIRTLFHLRSLGHLWDVTVDDLSVASCG